MLILISLIIVNSLAVIFLKKPVYAVLALVGVFIETGIIFLIFGAEFLAVLLITVYVGAIAILFLFVVMMLDLRLVDLYGTTYYSFPVGAFLGI
jgi:NADH-quinone oxidoreductase subunit J